mmetsp:Transcript_8255/g.22366  ORF Transcript_8255/g.22366 Transcript_8255/m.22366 type:complete len:512 (+) Transcript_8255:381-1916(+)
MPVSSSSSRCAAISGFSGGSMPPCTVVVDIVVRPIYVVNVTRSERAMTGGRIKCQISNIEYRGGSNQPSHLGELPRPGPVVPPSGREHLVSLRPREYAQPDRPPEGERRHDHLPLGLDRLTSIAIRLRCPRGPRGPRRPRRPHRARTRHAICLYDVQRIRSVVPRGSASTNRRIPDESSSWQNSNRLALLQHMTSTSNQSPVPHPGAHEPVPYLEVQPKVDRVHLMMQVVVLDRRQVPVDLALGEQEAAQPLQARHVRRNLVPGVPTAVDHRRIHVVVAVHPRVDRQEEADEDLVEKDDDGLQHVEAIAGERGRHPTLVVHRVHSPIQHFHVQQPMRPVEPGVVQHVQEHDRADQGGNPAHFPVVHRHPGGKAAALVRSLLALAHDHEPVDHTPYHALHKQRTQRRERLPPHLILFPTTLLNRRQVPPHEERHDVVQEHGRAVIHDCRLEKGHRKRSEHRAHERLQRARITRITHTRGARVGSSGRRGRETRCMWPRGDISRLHPARLAVP